MKIIIINCLIVLSFIQILFGQEGSGSGTYPNGDKYSGEDKYGKKHGQGIYTFADGRKYVGEFKDDEYHGQGTFTFANGDKYIGEFKEGKYHGQGTFTFANGNKYVGGFKEGKYHGQGTFIWADGKKSEGQYVEGKFMGSNTVSSSSGQSKCISGDCSNGYGTYIWVNGDKYVGEWKDRKKHGQGTYTFANGNKYVGEYKEGKYHGQGTFTFANGDKYVGEYKDGLPNGQGTYTYPDGRKYVGGYKDGKKHGHGTFTFTDGKKNEGEFFEGKFMGSSTVSNSTSGEIIDNPTVESPNEKLKVLKIEKNWNNTILTLEYTNGTGKGAECFCIDKIQSFGNGSISKDAPSISLRKQWGNNPVGANYKVKTMDNVPTCPNQKTFDAPYQKFIFKVTFEALDKDVQRLGLQINGGSYSNDCAIDLKVGGILLKNTTSDQPNSSSKILSPNGSNIIRLKKMSGGTYEVPCKVNDVLDIDFILDSGASEVSISTDVALTLIRTKTVREEDWLPGAYYTFADGSTAKSQRFKLKSIKIGNKTLYDVHCSIANSIKAPMLLGQNVLNKLGKVTIDYNNNTLTFE